jgi:hypothetical protein
MWPEKPSKKQQFCFGQSFYECEWPLTRKLIEQSFCIQACQLVDFVGMAYRARLQLAIFTINYVTLVKLFVNVNGP